MRSLRELDRLNGLPAEAQAALARAGLRRARRLVLLARLSVLRERAGRRVRRVARRLLDRLHPVELLAAVLAALVALASCRPHDPDPVVVVDPGPPFGPRPGPRVIGIHRTDDGMTVVVRREDR